MKRHLEINEVKDIFSRKAEVQYTYDYLEQMKKRIEGADDTTWLAFVPVSLVSCSQEYFRQIYEDIINSNRYLGNLKNCKCLKNANLNFEEIEKVKVDEITLGEYLSCYFPHNNVNDVKDNLKSLLGIDLFRELRRSWDERCCNIDFDDCMIILSKMYPLRHRICHEGICNIDFSRDEMIEMVEATEEFLLSSALILAKFYDEEANLSSYELSAFEEKKFYRECEELEGLIDRLKNITATDDFPLTFAYIDTWKDYREKKAKEESSVYINTTSYSYRYWQSLCLTTEDMIRDLRKQYHRLFMSQDVERNVHS